MRRLENVEGEPSEKCPCGRAGRFRLYRGNGMKLCLEDMQYWLSEKLAEIMPTTPEKP